MGRSRSSRQSAWSKRAADRNRGSSGSWTRWFLRTSAGMSGKWGMDLTNFGAMLRAPLDTKQIQVMAPEIYRVRSGDRISEIAMADERDTVAKLEDWVRLWSSGFYRNSGERGGACGIPCWRQR